MMSHHVISDDGVRRAQRVDGVEYRSAEKWDVHTVKRDEEISKKARGARDGL